MQQLTTIAKVLALAQWLPGRKPLPPDTSHQTLLKDLKAHSKTLLGFWTLFAGLLLLGVPIQAQITAPANGALVCGNLVALDAVPLIVGETGVWSASDPNIIIATTNFTGPTAVSTNSNGYVVAYNGGLGVSSVDITWSVTDGGGTVNYVVTVNLDNIDPLISGCPSPINLNTSGACTAVATWTSPTETDNCSATIGRTDGSGLNSGDNFPVGVTTIEYTATDNYGNKAVCSFDVTVVDNENPTISCPGPVSQNTDVGDCSAVVNSIAPTANDNCAFSVAYTISGATSGSGSGDASGTSFNVGISTVTYTVTDASGNTASCNFTVTISDNEFPVVTGNCSNVTPNGRSRPMWCRCQPPANSVFRQLSGNHCYTGQRHYVWSAISRRDHHKHL